MFKIHILFCVFAKNNTKGIYEVALKQNQDPKIYTALARTAQWQVDNF